MSGAALSSISRFRGRLRFLSPQNGKEVPDAPNLSHVTAPRRKGDPKSVLDLTGEIPHARCERSVVLSTVDDRDVVIASRFDQNAELPKMQPPHWHPFAGGGRLLYEDMEGLDVCRKE